MRSPVPTSRGGRSRNPQDAPPAGEQGYAYDGLVDVQGEVVETTFPTTQELREMVRRDAQGQAMDLALTLPIRRNSYDIEAAKGGNSEAKLARRVLLAPASEGGMTTPMESVVAQMTTAPAYGKACFEKVFGLGEDDETIYKKVAFRPASTCRIKLDKNGTFDGFVQEVMREGVMLGPITFKPDKSFVYLHGGHINPGEGQSAYVAAYNRYQHKRKVESLMFQNLMRFAGGIKHGKYGGLEGKAGARIFFQNLSDIRGQGTIVTGPDDEVELLTTDTTTEFREVLMYLNSEMARSVLAQFLMLGTESTVGSWALSKDHSDFFLQALEAIMREMESAINNHLIAPLVRYNFGVTAKIPRFRFQELDESRKQLAHKSWELAVGNGAMAFNDSFGPALEEGARQAMGIPPEAVDITIGQPIKKTKDNTVQKQAPPAPTGNPPGEQKTSNLPTARGPSQEQQNKDRANGIPGSR